MSMLDRRLQVLIDEERWARLEHESDTRRVSVSTLVREAIDQRYPGNDEKRRAALQSVLAAEPMDVPSPEQLKHELDEMRSRGFG